MRYGEWGMGSGERGAGSGVNKKIYLFSAPERAEFNKSCNPICS